MEHKKHNADVKQNVHAALFFLQWKWMVTKAVKQDFLLVMTSILVCSSVILIFPYYYSAY